MVLGLIILLLLLLWVRYYYVQQRKQKQDAERKTLRFQAMMAGEEKERFHLSRELRDGVDSSLAAAGFHIQFLEQQYPEIANDLSFLMARQLLLATSAEVRSIAENLSFPILAKAGLKGALEECCAYLFKGNAQVEVQTYGALESLSDNMTLCLYRIAYELLHRIYIHARARDVIVVLALNSRFIALTIEDDGIGIKGNQSSSLSTGLEKLKQRIFDFQGEITIEPRPERGTVVHVVIPWNGGDIGDK